MHTVVALETSQLLDLARTVWKRGMVPRTSSKKLKQNKNKRQKAKNKRQKAKNKQQKTLN